MNTAKQLSWVMVRTIGLALVIYSFIPLVMAIGSGYVAYLLRDHTIIITQSDGPVPDHQKDTLSNRLRAKDHGKAQASATVNSVGFLISLPAGLYCLKGGKAIQKLLMPPEENNNT